MVVRIQPSVDTFFDIRRSGPDVGEHDLALRGDSPADVLPRSSFLLTAVLIQGIDFCSFCTELHF